MKIKPKLKLPPVTPPPRTSKHKYRTGDTIKIGQNKLHITQVDYASGMVYYSVSYMKKGKTPIWGWIFAPFFDDLVLCKESSGPQKVGRYHLDEEDEPEVTIIKD